VQTLLLLWRAALLTLTTQPVQLLLTPTTTPTPRAKKSAKSGGE
jgi:hypothetical protein